jgi:hypothetical protein
LGAIAKDIAGNIRVIEGKRHQKCDHDDPSNTLWPDLRDVAMNMSRDGRWDQKERVILQWMVRVVDRVGPVDLK